MKIVIRRIAIVVAAGWSIGLLVAYACWWRIGQVEFNTYSDHWIIAYENDSGFRWEGRRFGCSAWIGSDSLSEPAVILPETREARIETVSFSGARFGWPFYSVGNSYRVEQTRTMVDGSWSRSPERVTTPAPSWYRHGVSTGMRNGYLASFPIEIQPLGMVGNTALYGAAVFMLALPITAIRRRRLRQ